MRLGDFVDVPYTIRSAEYFDFVLNGRYIEILMNAVVTYKIWRISNYPKCFGLKTLYNGDV